MYFHFIYLFYGFKRALERHNRYPFKGCCRISRKREDTVFGSDLFAHCVLTVWRHIGAIKTHLNVKEKRRHGYNKRESINGLLE